MNKANGTEQGGADLMDARAVAAKLAVAVRSVWRWSDAGTLPPPVRLGRLKRWRAADIDRWVAGGCRPWEGR
jgi:predicted DNA-binding transcriptional regulator AlpA